MLLLPYNFGIRSSTNETQKCLMAKGYRCILTKGVEGWGLKTEEAEKKGGEKRIRKLCFSILPPEQNIRMITTNSHVPIISFHCCSHVAYFKKCLWGRMRGKMLFLSVCYLIDFINLSEILTIIFKIYCLLFLGSKLLK